MRSTVPLPHVGTLSSRLRSFASSPAPVFGSDFLRGAYHCWIFAVLALNPRWLGIALVTSISHPLAPHGTKTNIGPMRSAAAQVARCKTAMMSSARRLCAEKKPHNERDVPPA